MDVCMGYFCPMLNFLCFKVSLTLPTMFSQNNGELLVKLKTQTKIYTVEHCFDWWTYCSYSQYFWFWEMHSVSRLHFFLKKQFLKDMKFTWTKDSPANIGKEWLQQMILNNNVYYAMTLINFVVLCSGFQVRLHPVTISDGMVTYKIWNLS